MALVIGQIYQTLAFPLSFNHPKNSLSISDASIAPAYLTYLYFYIFLFFPTVVSFWPAPSMQVCDIDTSHSFCLSHLPLTSIPPNKEISPLKVYQLLLLNKSNRAAPANHCTCTVLGITAMKVYMVSSTRNRININTEQP